MKADRKLEAIDTLTSQEIRQRIHNVEQQIAAQQVLREALEEKIPAILAEHTGSDLAAVKERHAAFVRSGGAVPSRSEAARDRPRGHDE